MNPTNPTEATLQVCCDGRTARLREETQEQKQRLRRERNAECDEVPLRVEDSLSGTVANL